MLRPGWLWVQSIYKNISIIIFVSVYSFCVCSFISWSIYGFWHLLLRTDQGENGSTQGEDFKEQILSGPNNMNTIWYSYMLIVCCGCSTLSFPTEDVEEETAEKIARNRIYCSFTYMYVRNLRTYGMYVTCHAQCSCFQHACDAKCPLAWLRHLCALQRALHFIKYSLISSYNSFLWWFFPSTFLSVESCSTLKIWKKQ